MYFIMNLHVPLKTGSRINRTVMMLFHRAARLCVFYHHNFVHHNFTKTGCSFDHLFSSLYG